MLTITHEEFKSALLGAQLVDIKHPRMRCEDNTLSMWCFADKIVSYVDAQNRNRRNEGACLFELLIVSDTPRGDEEARVQ